MSGALGTQESSTATQGGLRRTFRALRHRNYRLFFLGQGISLIGTWMQQIAVTWLVYRLTNSALLLGVVAFSTQIPTLVVTPIAGVLADRWRKHRMVILTQTFSMVQASVLATLTLSGSVQVWHIVVLSLALGVINAVDVPVRQSFIVEMVGSKEDLPNAIALNSSLFNGARLIGPSIAGILVALIGEGYCFLLNAVSYVAVLVALFSMRIEPFVPPQAARRVLQELREGFAYGYRSTPIRYILMLLALSSLFGVHIVLMPVVAREVLHGSSSTYGFLMAGIGIGALIGAMYLASRKSVRGLGRVIARSAGVFSLGMILFSFSHVLWLSLPLALVTGCGLMVQMASSNTILQTIAEDDKRGRVMSLYTLAFLGMSPFGNLLGGTLANAIGAPATLLIAGSLIFAGAQLFSRKLPVIREHIRPTYIKLGIIPQPVSET